MKYLLAVGSCICLMGCSNPVWVKINGNNAVPLNEAKRACAAEVRSDAICKDILSTSLGGKLSYAMTDYPKMCDRIYDDCMFGKGYYLEEKANIKEKPKIPEEAKVEDTQEENVSPTVKKPKFSFEEVTSGKDLFNAPKSACSICHGKDADLQARDKKLMSALSFSPQPTDLRNPKAIRFWGREEIIRVISQGIPNTSMVPMMLPKGNFTIEEIEKIATFFRGYSLLNAPL